MNLNINQTFNITIEIHSVAPTKEWMGEPSKLQSDCTAIPVFELSNNSAEAQRARLLAHLQYFGSITTIKAKELLNIYDPPARKYELVKQGYDIKMSWAYAKTVQGFTHRVGLYSLEKDALSHV